MRNLKTMIVGMFYPLRLALLIISCVTSGLWGLGQEKQSDPAPVENRFFDPDLVLKLTERAKPSIVTIKQLGRDGDALGIGSGFVVDPSGLIATNFHVIGEGRPVEVIFADGTIFRAVEIHASDRYLDLAILRIDPGGRRLVALPLADKVSQGQLVVGFGAPLGLQFSVQTGTVSAIRRLDQAIDAVLLGMESPDYPMIQLAMMVQQGNSGGPIVDLDGKVLGVITLRHRFNNNLAFAVRSSDLQSLLNKPNPIPVARWQTIGALDPEQWQVLMGGDWQQRGGTIHVKSHGTGFGGRSLCLSQQAIPEGAFEIAVKVRLDDEAGAAGLAFFSDSGDRHYGFYPSGGRLRLTRFDGPEVTSWNILEQIDHEAYRPGEWNRLRIRVDGDTITGYVNQSEVFSRKDSLLRGGKVGLCRFRQTKAQFREFGLGADLREASLSSAQIADLDTHIQGFISEATTDHGATIRQLTQYNTLGIGYLESKAKALEAEAEQVRELKQRVHTQIVINDLQKSLASQPIDLFAMALHIARIDDPQIDINHYQAVLDKLVHNARSYIDTEKGAKGVLKLRDFLFQENGFHGSRNEYYHHANSYINHVLDDREGLPITLAIVFIEMARRLGLEDVFGVAFPGQFLVGHQPQPQGDLLLIDVFEDGVEMDRDGANRRASIYGLQISNQTFEPSPPTAIAARMLRNLINVELNQNQNPKAALAYINILLEIEPKAAQQRFQRAILRARSADYTGARQDLNWLLEHHPEGVGVGRLRRLIDALPSE